MSAVRRMIVVMCLWGGSWSYVQVCHSAPLLNEPIKPLPEKLNLDPDRVALGRKLFFDKRFSRDNKVSCASCHDLAKGGADQLAQSRGVDDRLGLMNSPTVFNAGFNFRQLWDGRARTLEEQVDVAIISRDVFDTTWQAVIQKLSADTALVNNFKSVYGDGLNRQNLADALALFERSLITPSRFDAYLRGNANAITVEEKQGYAKFKNYGCVACHQGVNVGGNMFQVLGVIRIDQASKSKSKTKKKSKDGKENDRNETKSSEPHLGRYLITGRESDRYVFKVSGLRNVALTAPYFHNGSAQTLEQAIDVMAKYQLGRTVSPEDTALIIKFLNTLTGEPPAGSLP